MKGINHLIQIKRFLESKTTTRADGATLHDYLVENWEKAECISIDFDKVQVASVSFFDEAFGRLAEDHTRAEIQKKIRLLNMDDQDDALYQSILNSRLSQFRRRKKGGELDHHI